MVSKFGFLIIVMAFSLSLIPGCTSGGKKEAIHYPPHTHKYPFTQTMGDYHVRLDVDHTNEKMFLIFEDISERAGKLVSLRIIRGEIITPDGTVKEVLFRPKKTLMKKHFSMRLAGTYVERGEWLKETPSFTLNVVIPFEGEKYELTFDYEVPGGKIEIPSHRGY